MKTTKKILLFLGLLVLAFLISIPFRTEGYGDSYGERQRKIWNEQMAAIREDQLLTRFPHLYFGDDPVIKQQWEINDKFSQNLQKSSAPDWETMPPASPDLSKLPPEGMTFEELFHHAEVHKNPDAYLLLLSTSLSLKFYEGIPTKRQILFMKKWVAKAHELNRPGTDFLLRAIDKREHAAHFILYFDANGYGKFKQYTKHQLETIPGYKEFEELVCSGDFALYKALVTIWPGIHQTSLTSKLETVLLNKARQGDVTAQRQLGELGFLQLNATVRIIHAERTRPRSALMMWLSEKAEEWCPNLITISKEAKTSPTRDKLDEYAAWLKKAAEAGDLVAMHLWLVFGVETLHQCHQKDWNDILLYTKTLVKIGYERSCLIRGNNEYGSSKAKDIISRYYSRDSVYRLTDASKKTRFNRGSEMMTDIWNYQWDKHTREDNLKLLDRIERQNPVVLIGRWTGRWNDYFSKLKKIKDDTVKQRYIDIIRKTAHAGDPFFTIPLADIIRKNIAKPEEPGEDIRLLEQAWALCPKYNQNIISSSGAPHSHAETIVDMLMECYLINHPTADNQRKAFELAQQYFLFNADGWKGYHQFIASFYLSLMYQKGYGTPKDKEKEDSYYQQFQSTRISWLPRLEKKKESLIKKYNYQITE